MGLTGSRVAVLSNHIDFKIENLPAMLRNAMQAGQKQRRISNELKKIVGKYFETFI